MFRHFFDFVFKKCPRSVNNFRTEHFGWYFWDFWSPYVAEASLGRGPTDQCVFGQRHLRTCRCICVGISPRTSVASGSWRCCQRTRSPHRASIFARELASVVSRCLQHFEYQTIKAKKLGRDSDNNSNFASYKFQLSANVQFGPRPRPKLSCEG